MRSIAAASGKLEVVATEELSQLTAANLRNFDAVFFFTSGELPVSEQQKRDLLDFIRAGKGFGGAHSATDTFYSWPEYGSMIGGIFNGHPWVQQVKIDVEDPAHPASAPLGPALAILDEIYQFRGLSRENVRVLLRLDPQSVNLNAPGVNPGTEDFPLAWVRNYGTGRVFYTALGHFDETWRDPRFQSMLLGAMLWLTGQAEGEATPRPHAPPRITAVANAASFRPPMTVAPGSIASLFGRNLTNTGTAVAGSTPLFQLAGTSLTFNGVPAPLLFASPTQINAIVPLNVTQRVCITIPCPGVVAELRSGGGFAEASLEFAAITPGVFTVTASGGFVTFWATGLGAVERRLGLDFTLVQPEVRIGGIRARVQYSGLSPGSPGLYQINAEIPPGVSFPALVELQVGEFVYSTTQ
jgi:uncharacterized protein